MSSSSLPRKVSKLVFKGDKDKSKSSSSSRNSSNSSSNSNSNSRSGVVSSSVVSSEAKISSSNSTNSSSSNAAEDDDFKVVSGTGLIYTSSITVHGVGTQFMKELAVGDAIVVMHPTSLREETKIVKMVLSDVSIGISSAFSSDLISNTPFSYIKATPAKETEEGRRAREKKEQEQRQRQEAQAVGTYASQGGEKFVYRVKNEGSFGGYKIVSEAAGGRSREQLLDMRTKKKSDRYCY